MDQKTPEVFVKSNNTPLHDPSRRVLTVREREGLEQELAIRSGMIGATDSSYALATQEANCVVPPGMAINKARISERAKEIAKVLQAGTPEPFNSSDRDRASKRVKELEDEFNRSQVLETRAELRVMKRDNPLWYKAIDKAKMRPEWEGRIAEWRNLKRRLEPEDPDADSLDRIRQDK